MNDNIKILSGTTSPIKTPEEIAAAKKKRKAEYAKKYRQTRTPEQKERDLAKIRAWSSANKDKIRAYNSRSRLKYHYGITLDELEERKKAQNNSCKICGREVKLHVDHCHFDGGVRGLLCKHCNCGIGYFQNSPELLSLAISYLFSQVRPPCDH